MREALARSRTRGATLGRRVGPADGGGEGSRTPQATIEVAAWCLGAAVPRARYVVGLPVDANCEGETPGGAKLASAA